MVDELHKSVFAAHQRGASASEIDKRMALAPGTAHDAMVEIWRMDKASPRDKSYIASIGKLI